MPRQIEHISVSSINEQIEVLKDKKRYEAYDFAFIDLTYIDSADKLDNFLRNYADKFFSLLRGCLKPNSYCGVLSIFPKNNGTGFPIPWSIAISSRKKLKLRDEKVGLIEKTGQVIYCLFMQSDDDLGVFSKFYPGDISVVDNPTDIPSWTLPKSPPRNANEVLHPAKFPESLVEEFIQLFTCSGDMVFDPMAGTGSALIAALRKGRNAIGVELSSEWVVIGNNRLENELQPTLFDDSILTAKLLQGDATKLNEIPGLNQTKFDYVITSPPYWSMLTNPGSENQRNRRKKKLPLIYSQDGKDLGNIEDYSLFLDKLEQVYAVVAEHMNPGSYMTVVVKNIKRNHTLYCLAWDLTMRLCKREGYLEYAGTTLWCQDDVGLKPFAVGTHWVSNILHQYCLHFRKK